MKNAYMPTPQPRPHPSQPPGAEPERPPVEDESRKTGSIPGFDDQCLTPARPRPVRPPNPEGDR